ncbi:hypothetical protein GGI23_007815, partial [Coemansia sp. RSA 2559]
MNTASAVTDDSNSLDIVDLRNAIFQIVIQDAASHISESLGPLVPELVLQNKSVWTHSDSSEKTDQITQTVGRIQTLLTNIKQSAKGAEELVLSRVAIENKR